MKIEICDNTFWLAFWSVICTAITAIIIVSVLQYTVRTKAAMDAGYQEQQCIGKTGTFWTKK